MVVQSVKFYEKLYNLYSDRLFEWLFGKDFSN
jgi:hypothetical protein